MTYVIGETCIDVKDKACVEVCPVDAIYAEEDLPPEWHEYTEINGQYFSDPEAARQLVDALKPPLAEPV